MCINPSHVVGNVHSAQLGDLSEHGGTQHLTPAGAQFDHREYSCAGLMVAV